MDLKQGPEFGTRGIRFVQAFHQSLGRSGVKDGRWSRAMNWKVERLEYYE
jgi:hypothetical protein